MRKPVFKKTVTDSLSEKLPFAVSKSFIRRYRSLEQVHGLDMGQDCRAELENLLARRERQLGVKKD